MGSIPIADIGFRSTLPAACQLITELKHALFAISWFEPPSLAFVQSVSDPGSSPADAAYILRADSLIPKMFLASAGLEPASLASDPIPAKINRS